MAYGSEVIRTIEQIEKMYYGLGGKSYLTKADDPWLSTSTAAYNAIYGAYAWINANLEANLFGVLPKYDWRHSGWRVIKSKVTALTGSGISTLGGTPENGNIVDSVKPDMVPIDTKPKLMQYAFEVSHVQGFLATKAQDDNWGNLSQQRLYAATQFKELINKALAADVEGQAAAAGGAYTGVDHFESIDRIVSADAEEDVTGGAQTGWYDPYANNTLDRDSGTDFDSTILSASGTIGTNGIISDGTLRDLIFGIHKKGGKFPTVLASNEDTYAEVLGVYSGQMRYAVGEQMITTDVNGVQTFNGTGAGLTVSTVYHVPFIPFKDAPSYATDTSEIGRIFAFDLSDAEGFGYPRLGIKIAEPITYYEAGRQTAGYPFVNNKWGEQGVYMILGELICRHFASQGKIRDIKK